MSNGEVGEVGKVAGAHSEIVAVANTVLAVETGAEIGSSHSYSYGQSGPTP
jgi:hypothetical protein